MRAISKLSCLILFVAWTSAPLAAQSARPIYLYVPSAPANGQNLLSVYKVDPTTGALAQVPGSPFTTGIFPLHVTADSTGRFVYVADENSNNVSAFAVNATTGALTEISGSPFQAGRSPATLAADPTARYLYSGNVLSSDLSSYAINGASGALSGIPGAPFNIGNFVSSMSFDPIGAFSYFGVESSTPQVYSVDFSSGIPTLAQTLSVSDAPAGAYTIAVEPHGKFAYTTQPFSVGQIYQFNVGSSNGALSPASPNPASTGPYPTEIAFDPAGKYLLVANENISYQPNADPSTYDGSISVFSIDASTGALTPVPGSPFAAGVNPFSIVVDPSGHFVYVTSISAVNQPISFGDILGFSINQTNGSLTSLAGSPWHLQNPNHIAIAFGPAGTSNPAPAISSMSPSSANAGGPDFSLQVSGANFVSGASVIFAGRAHETTFVNSTQLSAQIYANEILQGATTSVQIFNPLPGGGLSTSASFSVFNGLPAISSINPNSVPAGSTAFSMQVFGTNFVPGSVVNLNGAALSTTFDSITELDAIIPIGDTTAEGTAAITVTNPAVGGTGGGTSAPVTLTILPANVQPSVSALSPASATAGGPGFTLTVTGAGFVSGSAVSFNLHPETTTFVNSTTLQAAIPASEIAIAGDPVVIVTNPSGGVSLLASFVINNPPPGLSAIAPTSAPAGASSLTLNVNGSNFVSSSVVLVNSAARATTFVSASSLKATLLPSDLATGQTLNVAVQNPAPEGGTTPAVPMTVTDYSVSPVAGGNTSSVAAGQTAQFGFTIAPSNGAFASPVSLTTSTLPAGVIASFSPSSVVTPGIASTPVKLFLQTMAHSSALPPPGPFTPGPGPVVFPNYALWLLLAGWTCITAKKRMRRLAPQLLLASLLVVAAGFSACAGSPSIAQNPVQVNPQSGTPAGTYVILVTATSGSVMHTTPVTLTVQ